MSFKEYLKEKLNKETNDEVFETVVPSEAQKFYKSIGIDISKYKIVIMPDKIWFEQNPGKTCVSQTSKDEGVSYFRKSYYDENKDNDKMGLFVHEIGHQYAYNHGLTKENSYPIYNNTTEQFAFGVQMLFLKQKYKTKDKVINTILSDYPTSRQGKYKPEFDDYYDYLDTKINWDVSKFGKPEFKKGSNKK